MIQEWGEDNLVEYLRDIFPFEANLQGIGDDCAVIPITNDDAWLITTDALTEGVHFLRDQISAEDLGYKIVAVNVSDVAAMGGTPLYAFLSLALPKDTQREWIQHLFLGINQGCEEYKISLLGGDTVGSKRDLFFNMTVIGKASCKNVKYRHDAKLGDVVCVTGFLGDSLGGLKIIQGGSPLNDASDCLVNAHFRPHAFVTEGEWLSKQKGVHAMMDISDGLDCDLGRLVKASNCCAKIEVTQLPISDALRIISLQNEWDPEELALMGGEDYCLLVTIAPDEFQKANSSYLSRFGRPLYAIGHIENLVKPIIYLKEGKTFQMIPKRFDHFL